MCSNDLLPQLRGWETGWVAPVSICAAAVTENTSGNSTPPRNLCFWGCQIRTNESQGTLDTGLDPALILTDRCRHSPPVMDQSGAGSVSQSPLTYEHTCITSLYVWLEKSLGKCAPRRNHLGIMHQKRLGRRNHSLLFLLVVCVATKY